MSSPDAHMWKTAWDILKQPSRRVSVQWIESHRRLENARSTGDARRIFHNNLVDRSASTGANALTGNLWTESVDQNLALQRDRDSATRFLRAVWQRHSDAETASANATAAHAGQWCERLRSSHSTLSLCSSSLSSLSAGFLCHLTSR